MTWDKNLPAGNKPFNVGDDDIRSNNESLEDGLKREHSDLALNDSDTLKHLEGSARTWVYDSATPATPTILDATYNTPLSAFNTGRVVVDRQAGRVWYCWNGASALSWIERTAVGSLMTFLAGAQIDTGQQLILPAGENHFADDQTPTPDALDVFAHGARHSLGGADPVNLTNLIRGLVWDFDRTGVSVNTGGSTTVAKTVGSLAFDFTGRASDSDVLLFCACKLDNATWSLVNTADLEITILINAAAPTPYLPVGSDAPRGRAGVVNTGGNQGLLNQSVLAAWLTGLEAQAHTIDLQARLTNGQLTGGNYEDVLLGLVDLGEQ